MVNGGGAGARPGTLTGYEPLGGAKGEFARGASIMFAKALQVRYIYIYIYVHTHTHTHTHIYIYIYI